MFYQFNRGHAIKFISKSKCLQQRTEQRTVISQKKLLFLLFLLPFAVSNF